MSYSDLQSAHPCGGDRLANELITPLRRSSADENHSCHPTSRRSSSYPQPMRAVCLPALPRSHLRSDDGTIGNCPKATASLVTTNASPAITPICCLVFPQEAPILSCLWRNRLVAGDVHSAPGFPGRRLTAILPGDTVLASSSRNICALAAMWSPKLCGSTGGLVCSSENSLRTCTHIPSLLVEKARSHFGASLRNRASYRLCCIRGESSGRTITFTCLTRPCCASTRNMYNRQFDIE
jgi:hypothetical protein